ncbi:MAG: ATP cone domain-containing protein [Candidatus Micrarchaeota archaeon]
MERRKKTGGKTKKVARAANKIQKASPHPKIPLLVVKRKGHFEAFDERKAYGSIYWASKSSHLSEVEAEKIANAVVLELGKHLLGRQSVDSRAISAFISKEMAKRNKDAAYMYRTHLDIS